MKEGVAHKVRTGLSHCAQDQAYWKLYCVNRYLSYFDHSCFKSHSTSFADRNMVMRYHLGHGVGHTYAHHAIAVSDPIISNLNVEMDHEVQDSISPETPTCNIAVTLSDIDEDNREDDDDDSDDGDN